MKSVKGQILALALASSISFNSQQRNTIFSESKHLANVVYLDNHASVNKNDKNTSKTNSLLQESVSYTEHWKYEAYLMDVAT